MQLHACLFLFLFTAETLASDQPCDGHVSLDQEPAGDVRLSLPGLFNDTSPRNQQLLNCTWVLDVPLGATVLLKLVWLDSGSRVWLRCVWSEDDQALERGTTALLSGCDGNKTTIIWTRAGRSSDSVHLSYYVQENERNSSEGPSTQDPSGWPETGTVKNIPTDAQGEVKSSEEGRSPLYEDLVWTSGSQFVSSGSAQDERPLSTTSPQHRLPVAGRADRETLPLPEEKWNNGADTSGASHLTSDPTSAGTLPYFQHAVSTDVESQTENPLAQTTSWTESTVSRSIILPGGDSHKSASTDEYTHAQTDLRGSSPDVPLTVSPSETPTWGRHTISLPHGGAITQTPEDDQALPWSDLTTTSDPLESSTQPPQQDSVTQNQPTVFSSSSSSHAPSRTQSPSTHVTGLDAAVGPEGAGQGDSFITDVTARITAPESSDATFENTDVLHALAPSTESQTNSPESTEMLTHSLLTQTLREGMQTDSYSDTNTIGSSSDKDEGQTSVFRAAQTRQTEHSTAAGSTRETYTLPFTHTDSAATDSPTPSHTAQTHSGSPHTTSSSSVPEVSTHTESVDHKTKPGSSQTSRSSHKHQLLPSTNIPTYEQPLVSISTAFTSLSSTIKSDQGEESEKRDDEFFPSSTTKPAPTSGPPLHPIRQNHLALTPSALTSAPSWSSTRSPMFYIVPNRPATIRVESVELLLQIVVEESSSALIPGLEEDTAAWVLPYLQRAPGFSRLLGVWSSGHAVQSLVVFKTGGALQWLGATEPASLLELTGLAQAVHEGRMFRSSKITNITLGGLQGDVCDWLLQCPAGYNCIPEPGTTNHSCSSVCRFDFCHHHGICTHHPGQLPVCRCLVGDDFWYMGQRCDVRMTRAHLVGACLAILLIIVTVIGILAFVAVQRYRAILIQAKVDQTRSSYRRFNHFDELSGRFWLRSWAGSADSLDNPAFTRSDELLHLRALDRPCCYHDDTLSLASTCPSHGARINTIYPHSSQYGWRGSGVSAGDGVLDSGKASDLSVCSWPVEPIHWTPFPLLQQLSSHRKHAVRVSRPRSYCEGMELVDLGKSWTA